MALIPIGTRALAPLAEEGFEIITSVPRQIGPGLRVIREIAGRLNTGDLYNSARWAFSKLHDRRDAIDRALRSDALVLNSGDIVSMSSSKKGAKASKLGKQVTNSRPLPLGNGRAVSVPAAVGIRQTMSTPKITGSPYSGDGSIRVRHREYFYDLDSTGAPLELDAIDIQIGNPVLFPWLSILAANFEMAVINKLDIQFESCLPTTAAGCVMLAVDYDPADSTPTSKQQIMAYEGAVRSPAWASCSLRCNPSRLNRGTMHYINPNSFGLGTSTNPQYSFGKIILANMGLTGALNSWGDVFVDYDITLLTPCVPSPASTSVRMNFTGTNRAAPFSNVGIGGSQYWVVATTSSISTVMAGDWLVMIIGVGTVFVNTPPTVTSFQNAVLTAPVGAYVGSGATDGLTYFRMRTAGGTAQGFTIDFTPNCTTIASGIVRIAPYNYTLL